MTDVLESDSWLAAGTPQARQIGTERPDYKVRSPRAGGPAWAHAASERPADEGWTGLYRRLLLTSDVLAIAVATLVGYVLRFEFNSADSVAAFAVLTGALLVVWLVALQANGCYGPHRLATGESEGRLVLRASAFALGALAVCCYALKIDLARGFVIMVLPLGSLLLLAGRAAVRKYVQGHRARGLWSHRILAVGTSESVRRLIETTQRASGAGLQVVGACVEDAVIGDELADDVLVFGGVRNAAAAAKAIGADVVAVTGEGLGPTGVRELGWQLEGTGRGLVMAPALTEIAGTRVHVSPVGGLPLVWLEQPQLARLPRLTKRTMDIVLGSLLLALATPVLLVAGLVVKITSRGPVFFRQKRLGLNGTEFTILKLRTMCANAEKMRAEIIHLNEQDGGGVLFKIRRDPRITKVGGILRKFSIDELPQLVHVVSGKMSLVGPRPLAAEDSHYDGQERRRLLVRPGVTGLWQVSGRSETTWADAVRMDLYYVENWSVLGDLSLIARTVMAVLGKRGAF